MSNEFFEEDEPVEGVAAGFQSGQKGVTRPGCKDCGRPEVTYYARHGSTQTASDGPLAFTGNGAEFFGPYCDVHADDHGLSPAALGRDLHPIVGLRSRVHNLTIDLERAKRELVLAVADYMPPPAVSS